jgi:Fic family protein
MPVSEQSILDFVAAHPGAGREQIRKGAAANFSETTIWRSLRRLVDEGKLELSGRGRASGYTIAGSAVVRAHLQTPYNQRAPKNYNKEFLDRYIPNTTFYLSEAERDALHTAGTPPGGPLPAGTYARRILERLLVDLAWASSRMEGNTYDILETEALVRFGKEASGKDRKEAVMILNHKEAIEYVVENLDSIDITRQDICNIHALLADGLLIDPAMAGRLREIDVGIGYSSYKPISNKYEIEEEFDIVIAKAHEISDPFEQSFFLLVHIPYLQAFADINKRTSRIASNITLLKADLAPMSFLTMNDREYIDALIGIYELNNVALLREIYIDVYLASAQNYKILRAEVETPDKAAAVYREFIREAIRKCVLEWKDFHPDEIRTLAEQQNIPEEDRDDVIAYARKQFGGLHAGNVIRYRLRPEDLEGLKNGQAEES